MEDMIVTWKKDKESKVLEIWEKYTWHWGENKKRSRFEKEWGYTWLPLGEDKEMRLRKERNIHIMGI